MFWLDNLQLSSQTASRVPEKRTFSLDIQHLPQQNVYEEHGSVNACHDVTTSDHELASMAKGKPDDVDSETENGVDDVKPYVLRLSSLNNAFFTLLISKQYSVPVCIIVIPI